MTLIETKKASKPKHAEEICRAASTTNTRVAATRFVSDEIEVRLALERNSFVLATLLRGIHPVEMNCITGKLIGPFPIHNFKPA